MVERRASLPWIARREWTRLRAWLWQERWPIAIFVAALLVRLHWNLVVHPLGEYIYSDMNGYNSRAERMVREPFGHHEYQAFFPFGTHMMIAGFKAIFGMQNFRAIGIGYALLGSIAVTIAYAVARRVSASRGWRPRSGCSASSIIRTWRSAATCCPSCRSPRS